VELGEGDVGPPQAPSRPTAIANVRNARGIRV
jgi:hypothetical protein